MRKLSQLLTSARMWTLCITYTFVPVCALLAIGIYSDSDPQSGFVSFTGKTELATVTVAATESQNQWNLPGSYICYDPEWTAPPSMVIPQPEKANDALCHGPRGVSERKHVPLSDEVSLSVARTTIEVAISDPPYRVPESAFPLGRVPTAVLIIKKVSDFPDGTPSEESGGDAILMDTDGMQLPLWDEAEIHIPIDEKTLMPYVGKINLGQQKSANSNNQTRSGTVAVYRNIGNLFGLDWLSLGAQGPQLIRETSLFPGDVLRFADSNGDLVTSAGFMKAGEDDEGGYIEIVSSMQSATGYAVVQRATPGPESGTSTGEIVIGMQFADAIFSHPYTVWLGAVVTLFVLMKEMFEFMRSSSSGKSD